MNNLELKELSLIYFDAFSNKDISKLSEIYDDDVHLIDWVIDVSGKDEVLNANKSLFENEFTLEVLAIENIHGQSDYKTANQIEINIEGQPKLKVLDVITFNSSGKITKIIASKL